MGDAVAADDWWHTLPPERRIQIWHWVAGSPTEPVPEIEGQYALTH